MKNKYEIVYKKLVKSLINIGFPSKVIAKYSGIKDYEFSRLSTGIARKVAKKE